MRETWLRPNRRALAVGLALPALLIAGGGLLAVLIGATAARVAGGVLVALGLVGCGILLVQMRTPRLAVDDRRLLVYARGGEPYQVPLDVVEGFLLSQGPTLLPGRRFARTEGRNVVIRLAENAEDWAQREVHPSLGKWCGSYITLRGTGCEPLSVELVQRLNERLSVLNARAAEK